MHSLMPTYAQVPGCVYLHNLTTVLVVTQEALEMLAVKSPSCLLASS